MWLHRSHTEHGPLVVVMSLSALNTNATPRRSHNNAVGLAGLPSCTCHFSVSILGGEQINVHIQYNTSCSGTPPAPPPHTHTPTKTLQPLLKGTCPLRRVALLLTRVTNPERLGESSVRLHGPGTWEQQ